MRSVGRVAAAATLLAATLAAVGCGASGPPSPPAAATAASASASPPSIEPSPAPSSPPPAGRPTIDMSLLDVLPPAVDGIALVPAPGAAAEIIADPSLGAAVAAVGVGLVVGPGSSAADDLAVVNVVRLRAGAFGADFFRDWRQSYDRAACEPAGGVAGTAEAEIGGRPVHIGSCAGGAHTYHVRLDEGDLLVSITSIGTGRYGERIVDAIGG